MPRITYQGYSEGFPPVAAPSGGWMVQDVLPAPKRRRQIIQRIGGGTSLPVVAIPLIDEPAKSKKRRTALLEESLVLMSQPLVTIAALDDANVISKRRRLKSFVFDDLVVRSPDVPQGWADDSALPVRRRKSFRALDETIFVDIRLPSGWDVEHVRQYAKKRIARQHDNDVFFSTQVSFYDVDTTVVGFRRAVGTTINDDVPFAPVAITFGWESESLAPLLKRATRAPLDESLPTLRVETPFWLYDEQWVGSIVRKKQLSSVDVDLFETSPAIRGPDVACFEIVVCRDQFLLDTQSHEFELLIVRDVFEVNTVEC